ncbi:hypothetical protein H4219_004734 [Mycoemilia scoparia]|uniref:Uncharacterized protein n=1 Tax=Mycoemilia scoparia TaxID=417184 RepID=A0A9W8DQV0_9FUNG|nr:hypothetical protein H4219_004734 [Mycoemilia scoparia]
MNAVPAYPTMSLNMPIGMSAKSSPPGLKHEAGQMGNSELLERTCTKLAKTSSIVLELCESLHENAVRNEGRAREGSSATTISNALSNACNILKAENQCQATYQGLLKSIRRSLAAFASILPQLTSSNIQDAVVRSGILNLQLAIIEIKLAYEEVAAVISQSTTPQKQSSSTFPSVQNNAVKSIEKPLTLNQKTQATMLTKKGMQDTSFLASGRHAIIAANALLQALYSCIQEHPSLAAFSKAEKDSLKPSGPISVSHTASTPTTTNNGSSRHRRTYSEVLSSNIEAVRRSPSSFQYNRNQRYTNTKRPGAPISKPDPAHIRNVSDSQVILEGNGYTENNGGPTRSILPTNDHGLNNSSNSVAVDNEKQALPQRPLRMSSADESSKSRQVRFTVSAEKKQPQDSVSRLTISSVAAFERLIEATKAFDTASSKLSTSLHKFETTNRMKRQGRSHSVNESTNKSQQKTPTSHPRLRRIHSSFSGTTNAKPQSDSPAHTSRFPAIKRKGSLTSTITPQGILLLHQPKSQSSLMCPSPPMLPHSPLATIREVGDDKAQRGGAKHEYPNASKEAFQKASEEAHRSAVDDLAQSSNGFLRAMIELSKIIKEPEIVKSLDQSVLGPFKNLANNSRQLAKDLKMANIKPTTTTPT